MKMLRSLLVLAICSVTWQSAWGASIHGPAPVEDAERAGLLDDAKKMISSGLWPHEIKAATRIEKPTRGPGEDLDAFKKRKLAWEDYEKMRPLMRGYERARAIGMATLDPTKENGHIFVNAAAASYLQKQLADFTEIEGNNAAIDAKMEDMHQLNPLRAILPPIKAWQGHYGRNKATYDALTKAMILGSAAAFMFNKFGGTEYVRAKIREAFDKPPIYTIRRHTNGVFGKKKRKDMVGENDIIMNPATRTQINELIFLLRRRYEMSKNQVTPGQTVKRKVLYPYPTLFYGPPGTGKTSIATMIADQSVGDDGNPMNFIALMASDFMQIKQEGDRLAVLKEMFEKAKKLGNTIIFLDEIDGMVQQRGRENEGQGSNRAFLDMLLMYLAKASPRYMVIAATNHANKIDDALMSRFRRKIHIGLPTAKLRKVILDMYVSRLLTTKGYTSNLDTAEIANLMKGDSGRDIESFVTRLRDRIDYEQGNSATQELATVILTEMGKISAPEQPNAPIDLDEELLPLAGKA